MSLILEALKKVENQHQDLDLFSDVTDPQTTYSKPNNKPTLLLIAGAALFLISGVMLWHRPSQQLVGLEPLDPPAETAQPLALQPPPLVNIPLRTEESGQRPAATANEADQPMAAESAGPEVMHINDLPEPLLTVLPHLKMDVHFFQERATARFVMINQRRYRSGDRLQEGPLLREINQDGIILEFQNQRFFMPRL